MRHREQEFALFVNDLITASNTKQYPAKPPIPIDDEELKFLNRMGQELNRFLQADDTWLYREMRLEYWDYRSKVWVFAEEATNAMRKGDKLYVIDVLIAECDAVRGGIPAETALETMIRLHELCMTGVPQVWVTGPGETRYRDSLVG